MKFDLFSRKEGKGYVPIDRVRELADKGFSEAEIIDILRKEGFSPKEISDALLQALRLGVESKPKKEEKKEEDVEFEELPIEQEIENYPNEEYIEYLVASRTAELEEKLREFSIRYEELAKKVDEFRELVNQVITHKEREENEVLQAIKELKESVDGMKAKVSALDRVLREMLPALIESVRILGEVVQKMKE